MSNQQRERGIKTFQLMFHLIKETEKGNLQPDQTRELFLMLLKGLKK